MECDHRFAGLSGDMLSVVAPRMSFEFSVIFALSKKKTGAPRKCAQRVRFRTGLFFVNKKDAQIRLSLDARVANQRFADSKEWHWPLQSRSAALT